MINVVSVALCIIGRMGRDGGVRRVTRLIYQRSVGNALGQDERELCFTSFQGSVINKKISNTRIRKSSSGEALAIHISGAKQ